MRAKGNRRSGGLRALSKGHLIKTVELSEKRTALAERTVVAALFVGFLLGLVVGVCATAFYILRVVLPVPVVP